MTVENLISALITPVSLGVIGYLLRDVLRSWLEKSIEQKFDVKLENLKADLRLKEQAIASDLHSKEAEISSLRNGILSGISNRHIALDKRRLQAAEAIWCSVIELRKGLVILNVMSSINIEVAIKETKKDPKAREFFEVIGKSTDMDFSKMTAAFEQPFASPQVWHIFSIYQGIILGPWAVFQALRHGIAKESGNDSDLLKSVKVLLPQYTAMLDKFGSSSLRYVLKDVEQLLLLEIRRMLNGSEGDDVAVQQSIGILKNLELSNQERDFVPQIPYALLRKDS
jgi:hypothetical protein